MDMIAACQGVGASKPKSCRHSAARARQSRNVRAESLITDDAIRRAQTALWSGLRMVAEPGSAAAFAALLSGRYRPAAGERVAVLLCSANTAAVNFEG